MTTTPVTLVQEVELSNGWFASKQSNGDVVLHNFPSSATLEDVAEDFISEELHFSPAEAAHIAQLIGIAI